MQPAPKTVSELSTLVDEAIFETQELVCWVEDEMDDHVSDLLPVFETIKRDLCELKICLDDGAAGRKMGGTHDDLPFMRPARTYRRFIPFYSMLVVINRAYSEGLEHEQ